MACKKVCNILQNNPRIGVWIIMRGFSFGFILFILTFVSSINSFAFFRKLTNNKINQKESTREKKEQENNSPYLFKGACKSFQKIVAVYNGEFWVPIDKKQPFVYYDENAETWMKSFKCKDDNTQNNKIFDCVESDYILPEQYLEQQQVELYNEEKIQKENESDDFKKDWVILNDFDITLI